MARPRNILPSYRKHKSSGQARCTINGRDYFLGPHGTKASLRDYDRIIAEYIASGRSKSFGIESGALTVAMLMADYHRHCRGYYGDGRASELHRVVLALRPLKQLYAKHTAELFGPSQLKAVRQTMVDLGWARPYVNANVKRIVRMFKWAAGEEKLSASVYETLRLVPSLKRGRTAAPETEPVKPVSQADIDATLPHLSSVVADMVRAQLLIGCRPGEICKLTPDSIDRSEAVWIATLDDHKTAHHGHKRQLFIGPAAQLILAPYLDREGPQALFRPIDAVNERKARDAAQRVTPASCGNRTGKRSGGLKGEAGKRRPSERYTTVTYRRAIERACDRAFPAPKSTKGEELKIWRSDHRWSPNQLRHSRGTDVRKQFGIEGAQLILGHSNADVTQVYAEADRAKAISIALKIG
ncbi:site-specific integrase [Stieleria sp. TO1_6]|uniref:site-specific integrase n=1 Tax=Stieleria tagensis TaxID=2956795 RepID=UPI00209B8DF6|nr:site-specific integrase [Stieleria tagensis]MCO8121468.1 site-specific integrase [Stieleria tagensis]